MAKSFFGGRIGKYQHWHIVTEVNKSIDRKLKPGTILDNQRKEPGKWYYQDETDASIKHWYCTVDYLGRTLYTASHEEKSKLIDKYLMQYAKRNPKGPKPVME